MTERLIFPVALWGEKAPDHKICSIHLMSNGKNLITGGKNGEICVWDLTTEPTLCIDPRYMILGHTGSILCIADGDFNENNSIVTSTDNGEMCLWSIEDGQCILNQRTQNIHTHIHSFKILSKECRLFCVGHYAEILVIDPNTFAIQNRLSSKDKPDWITSIHILQPPQLNNIVIIGLSIVGVVRIWTITDNSGKVLNPIYDNDSKDLECYKSVQIISNPESMRLLLIVCPKQWKIYDATDFFKLCSVDCPQDELWTGGNFITRDQVLVWSNKGHSYYYNVLTKRGNEEKLSTTKLRVKLIDYKSVNSTFICSPKFHLSTAFNRKLLFRGDSKGTISVWPISNTDFQESLQEIEPIYFNSLERSWSSNKDLRNNDFHSQIQRTCCISLPSLNKVAIACSDGSISITNPLALAYKNLSPQKYEDNPNNSNIRLTPKDYDGQITCLFYPNASSSRYDKALLLSGWSDFNIHMWDINQETLMHTFSVHAGSIIKFLVPPEECNEMLATSVCCIASDHSVSILCLKEKKCNLIASRQLFPINEVRWKLSEDVMVVSCNDGSIYVWKLTSGLLMKVIQGSLAEETLASCEESVAVRQEHPPNSAVELFKGLKLGNLSAIKNAAVKSIYQLATNQSQTKIDLASSLRSHPLTIHTLSPSLGLDRGFVMLFDFEAIIEHLLHDQNLVIEPFIIIISVFYSWGLEKEINEVCDNKTNINKQLDPACIGLISCGSYMSILFPNWVRKISVDKKRSMFFAINGSLTRLTGQCLSHLLFVPSSPALPLYSSLRHTAVKMIGRGFRFWEPYLDVAKVLLGLLDSCSEPDLPDNNSQALGSKRSAREAVNHIATSRPSVFITTVVREIAKHNNSKQQNSNFKNISGQHKQPILVKSRSELLKTVEDLISHTPLEMVNLITDVVDIILHCLDYSLLENRGLGEAFPAITKFYMVSYCPPTRRIAVGTVTGKLAIYELRAQSKPQIITAHSSAVSACSFSTDGRYLASYSAGENKLCFWSTTIFGLFGLGNVKTRCVGTIETPPIATDVIKNPNDILRVAKLIWFADKRVVLMLIDGRELCYQVA